MLVDMPKTQPSRAHIDMNNDFEIRLWARHLKISRDKLHRLVNKVGNSASAVQKELDVERSLGLGRGEI